MICRTLLFVTKKIEGCLRYVKKRQIQLVSVDRHHISCNEKHIIGIYPKLRFYSNCSYYVLFLFFNLGRTHSEHPFWSNFSEQRTPLWSLLWNKTCGNGVTEAELNVWWQHLHPRHRDVWGQFDGFFFHLSWHVSSLWTRLRCEDHFPYMSFTVSLFFKGFFVVVLFLYSFLFFLRK